jgi:fructose/tagatose bisphosphate aldolase
VEAELGEIGGVEDDISVTNGTYADPEKAARFLREAPVDVFAPSIGTAHGVYKGEPKISFEIIEKISRENRVPLALHGGTGLSDDVFRRCIALGCSKVNISTLLKLTFIESFETYRSQNPGVNEPVKILSFQYDVLKEKTAEKIRLFSGGRV